MSSKTVTESTTRTRDEPAKYVLVAFVGETTVPIELPPKGSVTIGRSSACDVVLDHPSISREHARIEAGGTVSIEDLKSRNGTRVRGVPLAPRQPARIQAGDVVECGDATLLLRLVSATGAQRSAGASGGARAFVVGSGGRSLQALDASPVNLGRRGALRRVLLTLARTRLDSPGRGLSVDDLLHAGWPNEKMSYDAGVARVYTTIQRLRALGLQAVLVTRDDGYLLDPNAVVRIEQD